jgi:hydroxyacylglutathione hydrolase
MKIFPIESGPVSTFGYLLTDSANGVAVVIDVPNGSAAPFTKILQDENVRLERILLTHSHWDHTADAAALQRAVVGATIAIHEADNYRLGEPNKYTGFPLSFVLEPCVADEFLQHGQTLSCGDWSFEIRHTPGHTEGGVCFIDYSRKLAFVGDTLFAGSVGRTDLPGGDTETLLRSIRAELFTLDDAFVVLAGHGERTTIGQERRSNPFVGENV